VLSGENEHLYTVAKRNDAGSRLLARRHSVGEEVHNCPLREAAGTWDCEWPTRHRFGWKGYIAWKRFSGGDIGKGDYHYCTVLSYVWTDMG
jgi:hypothetical protein